MYVNLFSLKESMPQAKQYNTDIVLQIAIQTLTLNTLLNGNLDESLNLCSQQTAHVCMLAWLYASGKNLHDLPLAC